MPALGESVTEGTVTRWLKQVGESVAVDEPLLEVSTDKVDTEIPSPVAGVVLEILVAEDETVEVGTELARIGSADEADAVRTGRRSPAPSVDEAPPPPAAARSRRGGRWPPEPAAAPRARARRLRLLLRLRPSKAARR